jgi:hypothetical protein
MSTEMDFKALWNKQSVDATPDIKELVMKAEKVRRAAARKLIIMNLLLLGTAAFISYVNFHIDNEWHTTKIGIMLMIVGMLSYLVVYNRMIPLIFKTNPNDSSQEYLTQLITIKRQHAFLDTVMVNVYFTFLSVGIALYMIQFVMRMTTIGGITFYVIIGGWIALAWFYLKPIEARRRQKRIGDMIARLEAVNGQLREE